MNVRFWHLADMLSGRVTPGRESTFDPKQTSSSMAVAEESCGIDYSKTIMTSVEMVTSERAGREAATAAACWAMSASGV